MTKLLETRESKQNNILNLNLNEFPSVFMEFLLSEENLLKWMNCDFRIPLKVCFGWQESEWSSNLLLVSLKYVAFLQIKICKASWIFFIIAQPLSVGKNSFEFKI